MTGAAAAVFVGDDWAEDHHDVEVMDESGRTLVRRRVPDGIEGLDRLHAVIAQSVDEQIDPDAVRVVVGIERDHGLWVRALIAAGYEVFAVNPLQAARFRDRIGVSGAKSDVGDAHALADMVRTDAHQLRRVAGDSDLAEAVKVLTRVHKSLIWDRTRAVQRLRFELLEYFPAAVHAFPNLYAPEAISLLSQAPDPVSARTLTPARVRAAVAAPRRRNVEDRTRAILAELRTEHLEQSAVLAGAYAISTRSRVAMLAALTEQITVLAEQVDAHFSRHPSAELIRSMPGMGPLTGPRVLAEFGDDPHRYASAKARRNFAGTSPITRQSGRKRVVAARHVHNDRLVDALHQQAFSSLRASPGAMAYYRAHRERGAGHHAALRQLANRWVGILHGCLAHGTPYDEHTAWGHRTPHNNVAA